MAIDQTQTSTEVKAATIEEQLKVTEQVRDLFARAHDYIAQAQYPGHMGDKVAEVLTFLKFHHADFKNRAENMTKQIEASKPKPVANTVDVPTAKAAVEATLAANTQAPQTQSPATPNE